MEKLKEVNLKATNELKPDGNLDLMDFISKSDFSTVGGKNNQQNTNVEFDFEDFNSNTAMQVKQQSVDEFFGSTAVKSDINTN